MHIPPVFDYPEALLFWIVWIWIMGLEVAHSGFSAGAPGNAQDAGTLGLINRAVNAAFVLAFVAAWLPWLLITPARLALDLGTALLILGSGLRRYCIRLLGRYFTAAVTVTPGQPVIERGPYRWVRHPGYSAGFLMYLGMGLALGCWLSLLIFVLLIVTVYPRRVQAEETALLNTLGEPYRQYMRRTKRYIPFVL